MERDATGMLGVEGDLRDARTVAQVDEDQATVVAAMPYPTGKRNLAPDVLASQLATGMGMHAVGIHVNPPVSAAPCRAGGLPADSAPA